MLPKAAHLMARFICGSPLAGAVLAKSNLTFCCLLFQRDWHTAGGGFNCFSFNGLINGLAAAVKRACDCHSIFCRPAPHAPHCVLMTSLCCAITLSAIHCQSALDGAHAWTHAWRFQFSEGPTKSAIMLFG